MKKAIVVKRKTLKYVLACDNCKKAIGKFMVRVSYMRADKGIDSRKQWSTKVAYAFHPKCFNLNTGVDRRKYG